MFGQEESLPVEVRSVDDEWNVLATAKNREQRHLARLLKRLGDFRWTRFLGVLVGRVEDHQAFFEQLQRCEEDEPGFLDPLARIVPIDRTFEFTLETFASQLKELVLAYTEQIDSGSFYVRIERRGHAGEIHSQALEQELDEAVRDTCAQKDWTPTVDFNDPDIIIVAETLGDACGIGAIPRSMRKQFPFVRVP